MLRLAVFISGIAAVSANCQVGQVVETSYQYTDYMVQKCENWIWNFDSRVGNSEYDGSASTTDYEIHGFSHDSNGKFTYSPSSANKATQIAQAKKACNDNAACKQILLLNYDDGTLSFYFHETTCTAEAYPPNTSGAKADIFHKGAGPTTTCVNCPVGKTSAGGSATTCEDVGTTAPKYVRVSTGTCESNGYEVIADATACENAAPNFQFEDGDMGAYTPWADNSEYPSGCIITPSNENYNYVMWNGDVNSNECDAKSSRDCLCIDTGGGGGDAQVCTSEDDFRGNAWGSYVSGSTTWVAPDTTDSSYDQTKITIITGTGYEGAKYDASIIDENDRQAFADECARGCSAKNTGYAEMYIHFQDSSNNYNNAAGSFQCFCRSGTDEPTFAANEPSDHRFFAAKYTCTAGGGGGGGDAPAPSPAPAPTYVRVSTGTCESNGYEVIADATACENAAPNFQFEDGDMGAYTPWADNSEYPSGCIITPSNEHYNYVMWNGDVNTHDCGHNSNRMCLCLDTGGGGGSTCASNTDQASCCAQDGCAFSNSDCIDAANLNGNEDACAAAQTFQPADRSALASAVNSCIAASPVGDCCRLEDGTFVDAGGQACASGVHISDWDTSLVTSMSTLFLYQNTFNTDISGWDVSSVTTFYQMFRYASGFDQDLSCWDVSAANTFQDMFKYASAMSATLCWDTSGKTTTDMFKYTNSASANPDPSTNPNCNQDCGSTGGGSTCPAHNGDKAACCAADGCAYAAGDDCIAEADLAGNPDLCNIVDAPVSDVNFDYGFQSIEACPGTSITIKWQGTHNIQETTGPDCGSTKIGSPLNLNSPSTNEFLSSGYSFQFANDELNAQPGTTRYFKCDTHCGTSAARFEVSCPGPVCPTHNDKTACCASGCAYAAGNDCIAIADLAGNPNLCNVCGENEHVSSGDCKSCAAGKKRPAGDVTTGGDTACADILCGENEKVVSNFCVSCPSGKKNAAGDNASGQNTNCEEDNTILPCAENEHVSGGVCVACPEGKHKPAGDMPPKKTDCWDDGSCGGDFCVDSNTVSCKDFVCDCEVGFSGVTCDRDITARGIQKMLQESRKKALPTQEEIIQRQEAIKDFARDTLKQKLKEGATVKDAIKETKIPIEPEDLPQKAQAIVQQIDKVPVVAVAPPNKDEEDTCDQGVDTPGCGMVDVDTSDELVMLSTDPEPGSWSVLTSGGQIISKQTRISDTSYSMQCWNDGWDPVTTVDTSDGAQLYECYGYVVMVASQTGICTPTICNNGNCTVDGSSYVCACEPGWSGRHCDEASTMSQCYEVDCSNYGGHKTLDHCGGTCNPSVCCKYTTKSAFNAHCATLTTSADYVSNNCCHRDLCI